LGPEIQKRKRGRERRNRKRLKEEHMESGVQLEPLPRNPMWKKNATNQKKVRQRGPVEKKAQQRRQKHGEKIPGWGKAQLRSRAGDWGAGQACIGGQTKAVHKR